MKYTILALYSILRKATVEKVNDMNALIEKSMPTEEDVEKVITNIEQKLNKFKAFKD